ncbi:MAG: hypothetical protein NTU98_04815 [Bacteroidetes bacterium]|nr:hypothetical protein [Bacteroidota bacterium]
MKKQNVLLSLGILLLSMVILFSSCKKKESDPAPVSAPTFTLSATPDPGITGNLIFYVTCTTDDVKMTRIDIKDPINTGIPPVDLQGMTMLRNTNYYLTTSYPKELGTWTFTFTGNRSTDNSSFVSSASLNITGK